MSDATPPFGPGTLPPEPPANPEPSLSPWPPAAPAPAKARRAGSVLMAALIGALVGALVAGGIVFALDDRGSTTTIVRSGAKPAVVSRPSTTITKAGNIATIIASAEPAIVAITADGGPGSGSGDAGTGFVITDDGYVVTNNHVIQGASKIQVAFANGDSASAKVVGHDPSADLAVLKVDKTGLAKIDVGNSDAVQVGDEVVAIGNALALEGGLTVTRGIISGTNRTVDTNEGSSLVGMLQTDAAINPGNSGGPLLDAQGKVIGINTAIANPASAQNIGFAIPISMAQPILDDLRLGRKPAFLGVSTQNVSPAVARELGLAVQAGAYVAHLTSGAPADKAGIKEGDVIVDIGGKTIASSSDVQTAVREHRPGDAVKVELDRKGQRVTVTATLGDRPADG